jgi:hypothetical protein
VNRLRHLWATARAVGWTVASMVKPPRQPHTSARERARRDAECDQAIQDAIHFEELRNSR